MRRLVHCLSLSLFSLGMALALTVVSFGRSAESAEAAGPGVAIPGLSRLALGTSASIGTGNLPKYAYVLLSPGESDYIPSIKAASPGTKVLAYQSASEAMDYCVSWEMTNCPSPVSYQQALAHDASNSSDPWLLYSSSGASLTMPYYPSNHLVNVGSASFQRQWASNAAATLRARGFDGIYMDSVIGRITDTDTAPTLYGSDAAWENAMRNFVAYVGPTLKAQGFYVLANTYKSGPNDGSDDIAWWTSLAQYVSGLQSEYFEQAADAVNRFDTNPCCWTGHWLNWLKLADAAQANGADFFAIGKGTVGDTSLMTYLRGSYLLVWNGGGGGFSYSHEPVDGNDPWNEAWTTYIGKPVGGRYQVGVGWRRDYDGGTVIVNPDAFSAQTVSLGGSYQTLAGATVSSITVQPRTAAILTSTGQQAIASAAPTNTGWPVLSGTARQGDNLYTSTGSWSGNPTSYSYQWKRCDSGGGNCAAIASETGSGYTVTAADIGWTFRATVTASNSAGSASATSVATVPAIPSSGSGSSTSAPANTGLPVLSGSAWQGDNLYVSTGSWSGDPTSYSYQWKRCDSNGNNCGAIQGETNRGYTVTGADVGWTFRATVTASNSAGSASATSVATVPAGSSGSSSTAPPANTGLPALSGSAWQGENLYASSGYWSGNPTHYDYQWLRCDSAGNNCAQIRGETNPGYTVTAADVGSTFRATVTASNSAGSASATSVATVPAVSSGGSTATSPPVNTALPLLSGTAWLGVNLYASSGYWSGNPTHYDYQWLRCNGGGNNCADIRGETNPGYTVKGADLGSTLRVTVTASNSAGSASATSVATVPAQQ